jgi:hypothetical protein
MLLQREALRASMEATQLREDLKLATGRLNTATGQAADLLQQLKSVQAENASLMGQLALSQGRDAEAAAAHTTLQQALEGMRGDLTRYMQCFAGPGCCYMVCTQLAYNPTWQIRCICAQQHSPVQGSVS